MYGNRSSPLFSLSLRLNGVLGYERNKPSVRHVESVDEIGYSSQKPSLGHAQRALPSAKFYGYGMGMLLPYFHSCMMQRARNF